MMPPEAPLPQDTFEYGDHKRERSRLLGVLRVAQEAGDVFHVRALHRVLAAFYDRHRAARRTRGARDAR